MSLRHHKEKLSSILWPFFHSPLAAAEGGQEEGEGEGQAGGAWGQVEGHPPLAPGTGTSTGV